MKLATSILTSTIILCAGSMYADIINGDFENGFDGWSIGYGGYCGKWIDSDSLNPENHFVTLMTEFNQSFTGGIYLYQTFFANAGESLGFDYKLSCAVNSGDGEGGGSAWCWSSLRGIDDEYNQFIYLADIGTVTYITLDIDWNRYSFPAFSTDGYYTIEFAAEVFFFTSSMDPMAPGACAFLSIDNVAPEPSIFTLLGIGLVCLLSYTRRLRKRQSRNFLLNQSNAS